MRTIYSDGEMDVLAKPRFIVGSISDDRRIRLKLRRMTYAYTPIDAECVELVPEARRIEEGS